MFGPLFPMLTVTAFTNAFFGVLDLGNNVQYRDLIPAPVDWTSASAWLFKNPWIIL